MEKINNHSKQLKEKLTDLEVIEILHKCGFDMSDELSGESKIISILDFERIGFDDPY